MTEAVGIIGLMTEIGERGVALVVKVDPAGEGAHPEVALAVLIHRADDIAAQARIVEGVMLVMRKGVRRPVEQVKSTPVGADPEPPLTVLHDGFDMIATEAPWVVPIMLEAHKRVGRPVEAVESTFGAHPQRPIAILP